MRSVRAVFIKQGLDMRRNPTTLIQFLVFPVVAFVFTVVVARPNPDIPDMMFVTMFAAIFAGMSVTVTMASVIAEDRERGSCKFLTMAGVKPQQYLLGVGGFVASVGLVIALVFAVMSGFTGTLFVRFWGVIALGVVTSTVLGATLGILARNQQAATAIVMPIALVLAFGPMLAQFNQSVAKLFSVFYTQQVSVLANDPGAGFANDSGAGLARPLFVIVANLAVLLVLFLLAYRARGLR